MKPAIKRVGLGLLALLFGLGAWVGLSANEALGPPGVEAPAPQAAIDWDKAGGECAELLSGLLKIPSINPPGNERAVAEYLAAVCAREGIEHELIKTAKGRALLIARVRGKSSEGALCLTNHIDVVGVDPRAWKSEDLPFSGEVIDGVMYGRGALDMKGFVAMQLTALVQVKRRNIPLEHDLVFLSLPDEEAGGAAGADWVVKNRKDLLKGIACMWNEGGLGIEDMPGMDRPVFGLMHAERGVLWMQLRAKGPGGHGSSAPPGNAPARLLEALTRLEAERPGMSFGPITRRLFASLGEAMPFPKSFFLKRVDHPLVSPLLDSTFEGNRFLKAISRNTRNLTALRGGSKVNVIPAEMEAKLDMRLLPGFDPDEELGKIKALIADLDIEVEVIHAKKASESPVDHPLFDIIRGTVERLNPGAITVPMLSPGGTDSSFFRPLDIPCYGLIPCLVSQDETKGFHGANERIKLKSVREGAQATFEAAVAFSQRP